MFFWVGLAVVFLIYLAIVLWASRGTEGRAHKPGTQRLRP
jgi:hypothetical protein